MAEGRQIGRIEEVDVALRERQPCLMLRMKLADGSRVGLSDVVSSNLLRDFLDVWSALSLWATRGLPCWVVTDGAEILALEPLMPDEGEALRLRSAVPEAVEASGPPPGAGPAPTAAQKSAQQTRWRELKRRADAAKINIEECRPTVTMSAEDIETMLEMAAAKVAAAEVTAAPGAAAEVAA
jgi:hypothetical protein